MTIKNFKIQGNLALGLDGVKIIGAGTASGDGFGYGTLELVPDNDLYTNDQYLIIDPTAPQHIHIRAGGTQDASNAYLILGGEQANVTVNDFSHNVTINTWNGDAINYNWMFGSDGKLTAPGEVYGQYFTLKGGGADGTSIGQVGYGGDVVTIFGTTGVGISAGDSESGPYWQFGTDASTTLPGALVLPTVSPAAGTLAVGQATAITVTNSPNTNWTNGTGVFANGINFAVAVDGSGNATVSTITDGGTGHFVGETFGPVPGTAFGGTSPADDMYFEVTTIAAGTVTALDLTKQVQILTATPSTGLYSLADGVEGQIMYFVPASGVTGVIYILVANARLSGEGTLEAADYSWQVFFAEPYAPTTIATAIFANGAWCLRGGTTD